MFLIVYAVVGILVIVLESRRYNNTWKLYDKVLEKNPYKVRGISRNMDLVWNKRWLTDCTAVNFLFAALILILYPISMVYVEVKIRKTRRELRKVKEEK